MYVNQHIVRPFASLTFLCFDFDYNDFFSVLTQDFSYMTYLDHHGGTYLVVLWGTIGVEGAEVVLSLVSLVL